MKKKIDLLLCALSFCASAYALTMYFLYLGPLNFSYFTSLSNLLIVVVALWRLLLAAFQKDKEFGVSYYAVKFVAVLAILITFLVYLLILAPTNANGFFGAYKNYHFASLCAHVVSPLLILIHFFAFDPKTIEKKLLAPCSLAYPLAYTIPAFGLGLLGVRWDHDLCVPYNFFNYKAACGWFGFEPGHMDFTTIGVGVFYVIVALLLVFALFGRLLWGLKRRVGKSD
ncbi:MAG: hypothetical protein K6A42_04345 [Treponema sp.]|nr:hypothetical protein [Treponema sp.]